jgi:hypothetical protein
MTTLISPEATARDKEVKVALFASKSKVPDKDELLLNIKLTPPSPGKEARQPTDLVCIIDTSGSMGTEARIQGSTESSGLNLLDIAKHGVKTIAHTLGPDDRLSLVTFSHMAKTIFELVSMDQEGHDKVDKELDLLNPGGGTDIWAGLEHGLNALQKRDVGRFGHIMLLTDGESQNRDMIVPNLKAYQSQHEALGGTINTFGFGYNLDSRLLVDLAKVGSGSYSFIPDAGFVGTAFVNSAANLLSTMGVEVSVALELEDGNEINFLGGHECTRTGDGVHVNVGAMQYGQTKDLVAVVKLKNEDATLFASVTYKTRCGEHHKGESQSGDFPLKKDASDPEVAEQHCRCLYVDGVGQAIQHMYLGKDEEHIKAAAQMVADTTELIRKQDAQDNKNIETLLQDITIQTTEALSKMEFYNKWGIHYLPSIRNAHELQQCNNFKDPGVQNYGGDVFADVQEKADNIFNDLPPPKPKPRPSYGGGGVAYAAAPVDMSQYNNRFGG